MMIDKTNSEDVNKELKKNMIWFHTKYMKTERENQLLWINNQISHLNNLKRFVINSLIFSYRNSYMNYYINFILYFGLNYFINNMDEL